MERMGMQCGGRRNRLGVLHGPRNEESLNGTHPALCAFLQTNSDVQLPFRFATTEVTHAAKCSKDCAQAHTGRAVVEQVQASQDAQVGYACDYQNKRAARSCNEVKECVKGHRRLNHAEKDQRPAYIGKRHVTRLCSDAYGRGICRSNQESIKMRVGGLDAEVTSAESFHTASFVCFPGKDIVRWRETVYENADYAETVSYTHLTLPTTPYV